MNIWWNDLFYFIDGCLACLVIVILFNRRFK